MIERVHLYPGMGKDERHYLDKAGTVEDLKRIGIELREGMTLHFYDFDGSAERDDDKLLFEGTVHFDALRQEWFTIIDWNSFRHESEEEKNSL